MTERPGPSVEPAVDPLRTSLPRFNMQDLLPRALSAIVMVALALATAFVGGFWFALLWLAAGVAIHWEWQTLIGGPRPVFRFVLGGLTLVLAGTMVAAASLGEAILAVAAGAIAVAAAAGPGRRGIAGSGVAYASALVLSLDLLRHSVPDGFQAIIWLFAVVWGTDVMAYFGGRLIGGPRLLPSVSPSKTWAGFLVGIASGSLAGLAVAPTGRASFVSIALGLVAGAIAQGGDLFESAFKRRYGVKDSSHLIPGHGGVMDRLDGFVAAATFAACLGVVRFGVDAPGAGLFRW